MAAFSIVLNLIVTIWDLIVLGTQPIIGFFTTDIGTSISNINSPWISDVLTAFTDWLHIGDFTVLQFLFSGIIVVFLVYTLLKWIIGLVF